MDSSKNNALWRYLAYAKPYRWSIVLMIAAGVTAFVLQIIPAEITRHLVDRVISNQGELDKAARYSLLAWLAGGLVAITAGFALAGYVQGIMTVKVGTSMVFDLRQNLWKHLQRLSLDFHQSRPTGTLLSRLMSDIGMSQQMINGGIVRVVIDMGSASTALVVLFFTSWKLTLVVLAILPVYAWMYRKINPQIRQASHAVQEQRSVMSGLAVERLNGIAVVQTFAQEPAEARQFAAESDQLRGLAVHRGRLAKTLGAASTFLVAMARRGVWVIGAALAIGSGELTAGQIIKFTAVAGMLYNPIRRFSEINVVYQTSMAAIERVFSIFDIVPEVRPKPDGRDSLPGMGDIRFVNVAFRYGDGPEVLKDVGFSIRPGERVAVVGESGAGKSTLVTLIPRLYDVTDGAIYIDGVDLRDYRLRPLRRSIGIVLQDTILFSGTVAENLRYGRKDATDAEIVAAATAANAHDFISALPDGYETLIGERGMTLSGGQRQRVSLARTILQDPRILILDEATSSLDSESENLITEALERVMTGRTCLIIAHRLSTIMGADRILVFKEGRLVESGGHADLLRAGGYYRHLFEQQFGPLQDLISQGDLDA